MNRGTQRRRHRWHRTHVARLRNTHVDPRRRRSMNCCLMRELVQSTQRLARHAQPGRVLPELKRCWRRYHRLRQRLRVRAHQRGLTRQRCMGRRHTRPACTCSSIDRPRSQCRHVVHAIPRSARHPAPTHIGAVSPRSIVIWSPSPGIRRYPRVARARIPGPCTVRERIPCRTCKIRTPHRATAARVHEVSVVHHVAQPILIRRIERIRGPGCHR